MLRSFLLLFAGTLFALAPTLTFARTPQQSASQAPPAAHPAGPAHPATPPKPAAPAKQAAPTGPMPLDATNPVKPTHQVLAKAKTLFDMDCALCHGESGNGQSGVAQSMGLTLDNWTDPKTLAGNPDGQLFDIIRTGMGKMPPEGEGRANNPAVWGLILYIRSFSQSQPAASGSAPQ